MNLQEFADVCISKAEKAVEKSDGPEAIRLLELLKQEINMALIAIAQDLMEKKNENK
jgi:hypothetical protein